MKNITRSLLALLLFLLSGSCEKQEMDHEGLALLYQTYKNGEISECQLEGETVYLASLNQVDSPMKIFDIRGRELAECNYAWGKVDPLCEQLSSTLALSSMS